MSESKAFWGWRALSFGLKAAMFKICKEQAVVYNALMGYCIC